MLRLRGLRLLAFAACIACVVACNNKEIAQMQEQIKQLEQMQEQLRQHEEELQQLKVQVEALNETVSALQGAVVQMQSLSYVTGVTPDIKDGITIGYTIAFSSGESIYMSCSAQETPRVGIKAMSSERYYWTLNDELMLNDDGYIIPVEKNSAPLFKTQGTDWYVSINGGRTWEATSSGASASSPFKSIDTSNPNYVLITLGNGTVLQLTTWSAHVALQNVVEQLRKNLAATKQIVEAVNKRDYLTAITPLFDNGVQTGWILSFSNSGSITISCTGDISDIQDLPEELEEGNYITQIDTSNPNYISCLLSDSTSIDIPRYQKTYLVFTPSETPYSIEYGQTIDVEFTLQGSNPAGTSVTATSDGNFVTEILRTSDTTGILRITCIRIFTTGNIILILHDNGTTTTTIFTIPYTSYAFDEEGTFDEFKYDFATDTGGLVFPPEGGTREMDFPYVVAGHLSDIWARIEHIGENRVHRNAIVVQPNPYREDRLCMFCFWREFHDDYRVVVKQLGNPDVPAHPYWNVEFITFPPEGGEYTLHIKLKNPPECVLKLNDSSGFQLECVSPMPLEGDTIEYILRASPISQYSPEGTHRYVYIDNGYTEGKIEVTQLGWQR